MFKRSTKFGHSNDMASYSTSLGLGSPLGMDEVRSTIPLSWPVLRHKQEIAYRKDVIFFTAVPWNIVP